MEDSYISYNAIDEVDNGSEGSDAIVSAVNKKRKAQDKEPLTKKKPRAKAKLDPTVGDTTAKRRAKKPVSKPKAKAKPKTAPKTKPKTKPKSRAKKKAVKEVLMSAPGLVTRGVHAGLRSFDAVGSGAKNMSVSAWSGVAAAVVMMTLTILAWNKTPEPPHMPLSWHSFQVHTDDNQRLPDAIWRDYVNKYPKIKSWVIKEEGDKRSRFKNPSRTELENFAQYLKEQSTIASVNDIKLSYVEKENGLQRAMYINVTLRSPSMPVILANGQKAWVDEEGILLPGLMPVPDAYKDRPVVRGIEAHPEALKEVLSFWPDLEAVIEPDLITNIYLDRIMQRRTDGMESQRGIVLISKQGTKILWGRPGDERFGLSHADKIRNLVRTLKSQGDLRNTEIIDVRHSDPKYILAHHR